jgi:hypothetical protein
VVVTLLWPARLATVVISTPASKRSLTKVRRLWLVVKLGRYTAAGSGPGDFRVGVVSTILGVHFTFGAEGEIIGGRLDNREHSR